MNTFTTFSEELLNEYQDKYKLYMDDLCSTIQDVYQDVIHPSCPTHIRSMLSNSYKMLLNKKKEYEDMHNLIISSPEDYFSDMKQFIVQYENSKK